MKCRKSTKTTPGAAKNDPKRSPRRPKTTPRGAQDDQKSDPERQDEKRTEPRRSWDHLGSPKGRFAQLSLGSCTPLGSHLGGQNGTKIDPKTIKNRSEKSRVKKTDLRRSWIRLGAILCRLGCHLGALETLWHYACRCFVNIHFFDVKTVRRRSWDQLWPTKAPKRPKMTPKTEPKSTPRRSKIDVKIVIKNDAKTKRAQHVLTRGHWVVTPPRRRPRDPGEAAQTPWDL